MEVQAIDIAKQGAQANQTCDRLLQAATLVSLIGAVAVPLLYGYTGSVAKTAAFGTLDLAGSMAMAVGGLYFASKVDDLDADIEKVKLTDRLDQTSPDVAKLLLHFPRAYACTKVNPETVDLPWVKTAYERGQKLSNQRDSIFNGASLAMAGLGLATVVCWVGAIGAHFLKRKAGGFVVAPFAGWSLWMCGASYGLQRLKELDDCTTARLYATGARVWTELQDEREISSETQEIVRFLVSQKRMLVVGSLNDEQFVRLVKAIPTAHVTVLDGSSLTAKTLQENSSNIEGEWQLIQANQDVEQLVKENPQGWLSVD